jgi:hypothetical protein
MIATGPGSGARRPESLLLLRITGPLVAILRSTPTGTPDSGLRTPDVSPC